ncbi:hypothetical protein IscW_ISCW009016, partial [Ixodes scapularis]
YVPITNVLRNLMFYQSLCDHLDNVSTVHSSPLLRTFRDGLVYNERLTTLLQGGCQYTVFLVLYSDEVEIVNPLGSKRGVHKLLVVYFSVLNIHARYRSQVRFIHVAIIARYKLVVDQGIDAILEPLLIDVFDLERIGFTLDKYATTVRVTAVV